ncbi:2OG-Fe(II) oxygenase family protein [Mucilaginibacter gynuensis]|uniref:2OG-Fe(II) oxygenase family protein n=1 Tax=Mucilaginibacter gynuensis TaxID=1302236 RepID=A0ABP8HNI9_9SPHI
MEKTFNTLIDSFIDDEVGIADNFLSAALAAHLTDNITALYQHQKLLAAGTGNGKLVVHDLLVRSDKIYWLDRKHNNVHENAFFDLMDEFVSYLNSTCYTGITGYEFHYTVYEKGSFYKKHIDQFKQNGSRKYSMIFYLNADWVTADGGELCLHHKDSKQFIAPMLGKSVLFKSNELEHEVMPCTKQRISITGWLKGN